MADRSFIYCPFCEKQNGMQIELLRGNPESHLFRCQFGHVFDYSALMAQNPTKMPLQVVEKPAPTDIQATFWIQPEILNKYRQKFQNQQNSTINSILAILLDDDYVVISGEQARKLKSMNIKNGAEMVACAENNNTLTSENEMLVKENDRFYSAVREKMGAEV
jgi:hypothetical protein